MPKANEKLNAGMDSAVARQLKNDTSSQSKSDIMTPELEKSIAMKKTYTESQSKDIVKRGTPDPTLLGSPDVIDAPNEADNLLDIAIKNDEAQNNAHNRESNYKASERYEGRLYKGEPINGKVKLNGVRRIK